MKNSHRSIDILFNVAKSDRGDGDALERLSWQAIFRDFRSRNSHRVPSGPCNKRRNERKMTGRATKRHERRTEWGRGGGRERRKIKAGSGAAARRTRYEAT